MGNTGRSIDEPEEQSPTRKPHVLVLGKTAELIRGDYGASEDKYRRYQDNPPPAPGGG